MSAQQFINDACFCIRAGSTELWTASVNTVSKYLHSVRAVLDADIENRLFVPMIVVAAQVYIYSMDEVSTRGWPNFRGLVEPGPEVDNHPWSTRSQASSVPTRSHCPPVASGSHTDRPPVAHPTQQKLIQKAATDPAMDVDTVTKGRKTRQTKTKRESGPMVAEHKGKGKAREVERGWSTGRETGGSSRSQSVSRSRCGSTKGKFKPAKVTPTDSEDNVEITAPPNIATTVISPATETCKLCKSRGLTCTPQPGRACAQCKTAKRRCSQTPSERSSSIFVAHSRGRSRSRPPAPAAAANAAPAPTKVGTSRSRSRARQTIQAPSVIENPPTKKRARSTSSDSSTRRQRKRGRSGTSDPSRHQVLDDVVLPLPPQHFCRQEETIMVEPNAGASPTVENSSVQAPVAGPSDDPTTVEQAQRVARLRTLEHRVYTLAAKLESIWRQVNPPTVPFPSLPPSTL
ncbi:hypothetical protein BU15DRAFT_67598 [Melanogaster broomeanus]|nr:hypothetical protein BU15DRAFT_67598 [Melanogaster broomeanus]